MAPEEVCDILRLRFSDAVADTVLEGGHPYVQVVPDRWPEVALFLRDDPRLAFNLLRCISTLDLLADNQLGRVARARGVRPDGRPLQLPSGPAADPLPG